ncbi:hypothetical protein N7456_000608 [Penicillium angulare]|uniref:Pre-mRNA-splicing factor 38B n=1 Tax=Penicillium angulare TaxID=116970 RepID=A0A9W9GDD7_9EURO|nr:hypothetical protein N7456_000608 [Penicillium angulare]
MDDDYVAQVLAKEARESSQNYSSNGLSAFMPRKPTGNAPKPNTRFLRHLIKETDTHNTALKRKEEREARERMRALRKQTAAASESTSHSSRRDRASTRDTERSRHDHDDRHRSHRRRHRSRSTSTDRDRSRRHRHRDEKDRDRTTDDRHDRSERREPRKHESSRTSRRDRERSYSRSRSRSPRRGRDRDRTSKSHRSERSRRAESPSRPQSSHSHRKSRESEHRSRREEQTSSHQHRLTPPKPHEPRESKLSTTTKQRRDYSEDSDPLEDLVGPLHPSTAKSEAPIRSRGRGAYRSNTSNIDAHFASDYDPTLDIQPDEDEGNNTKQSTRRHVTGLMTGEDDWDMALEALRDRTKWKQKGEERLRAAGINENAIDRWKKEPAFTGLDGERRPEDVRWFKSGEGREWDRGKFVDDEGHIDVRAAWPKST